MGRAEQATEALLMGLRLGEGVDCAELTARFGFGREQLIDSAKLALHRDLGLVAAQGSRIIVTDAGMPLLDALLADLVAGELVAA